ncbi:NADH-quinone oxidoreductase subunit NuoN [Nanchangia anserum]|uniref:NADH-quinone oxidoreductase subunit N n=2 Tax=Nanchangia anserum TaxID=2692125 RepID=A0A8I0GED9_9ACTO|nr:NADH-quinone oxidoreductase subunit NuoN [Nanchangia anserum]QOX82644.1 NADH-quinone oxidoreductase subunit NuoN [Nanchangia anserum]
MQASLDIDWGLMAPLVIVGGAAVLGVLIEAFVPRGARWKTQAIYTPVVLVLALCVYILTYSSGVFSHGTDPVGFAMTGGSGTRTGELLIDPFAAAAQVVILVIAILSVLVMIDRTRSGVAAFAGQPSDMPGSFEEDQTERRGYQRSEMLPLTLFSTAGMMLFPMCTSLLTLFIALEVMSLPLYILCATARHRRLLSQEAALKYFILGAFSSAFFLMGIALLFGYAGSLSLSTLATAVYDGAGSDMLLISGIVLLLIGLLFKVGAVPFHAWTPDVYQGAPTPVTGFMAAGVKAAAFLALVRFYFTVAAQMEPHLKVIMWAVIVLTIVVGTFFGLVQDNVKRLLAYSSIAHAGFILIAVQSLDESALSAVTFYVLSYGIATVGAFGVITLVRGVDRGGNTVAEQQTIDKWAGLGRRHPWLGAAMIIFLLSFAGIPLTSGFIGKWTVFAAGIKGGLTPLVIVAIVASAITAFYYFRLVKVMFLDEPDPETRVVPAQGTASAAIAMCAIATLALGIVPGPVLNLLGKMVIFVL